MLDEVRQGRSQSPGGEVTTLGVSSSSSDPAPHQAPSRSFATVLYADSVRGRSAYEVPDPGVQDGQLKGIAGAVGEHGGQVAGQSAGALLALFDQPGDALRCALKVQHGMTRANRKNQVCFRIGIDCGDVNDDRGELSGDPVSVAMRLEALAAPGGVCISDQVRAKVEGQVSADCQFIGEPRARQVAEPIRACRVAEPSGKSR